MRTIIGSDGKECLVKEYHEYLAECKADGIPPILSELDLNEGYLYCNPNLPHRDILEIHHLKQLIRALWFHSRFLNKNHMYHYYFLNLLYYDRLRELLRASSSKSKTSSPQENPGATPGMVPHSWYNGFNKLFTDIEKQW